MAILVASGNLFRRELSVYILSEARFSVREATTADELLAQAAEEPTRLLVVDVNLVADPRGLLERLRQRSAAPILWLASGGAHLRGDLALADGYCDTLSWPYQPEDLLAAVSRLLARGQTVSLSHALGAPTAGAGPAAS